MDLKYFKIVTREKEIMGKLTGASYLLLGYTITIFSFSEISKVLWVLHSVIVVIVNIPMVILTTHCLLKVIKTKIRETSQ